MCSLSIHFSCQAAPLTCLLVRLLMPSSWLRVISDRKRSWLKRAHAWCLALDSFISHGLTGCMKDNEILNVALYEFILFNITHNEKRIMSTKTMLTRNRFNSEREKLKHILSHSLVRCHLLPKINPKACREVINKRDTPICCEHGRLHQAVGSAPLTMSVYRMTSCGAGQAPTRRARALSEAALHLWSEQDAPVVWRPERAALMVARARRPRPRPRPRAARGTARRAARGSGRTCAAVASGQSRSEKWPAQSSRNSAYDSIWLDVIRCSKRWLRRWFCYWNRYGSSYGIQCTMPHLRTAYIDMHA